MGSEHPERVHVNVGLSVPTVIGEEISIPASCEFIKTKLTHVKRDLK